MKLDFSRFNSVSLLSAFLSSPVRSRTRSSSSKFAFCKANCNWIICSVIAWSNVSLLTNLLKNPLLIHAQLVKLLKRGLHHNTRRNLYGGQPILHISGMKQVLGSLINPQYPSNLFFIKYTNDLEINLKSLNLSNYSAYCKTSLRAAFPVKNTGTGVRRRSLFSSRESSLPLIWGRLLQR
jgi:hypothetical protein